MSNAFAKVVFRGRLMDEKTKAFLLAMEEKLGYELTVVQGCYNPGGVAQSGGTHDGGGVIDLAAYDWKNKVKVAADLGAFVWRREYVQGLWGEHVHLGIRDHGRLSSSAANQQRAWDSRPPRDGLKSNSVWSGYHPGREIVFKYPAKVKPVAPKPTNVTKARDELVQAIHSIAESAALMTRVDANRPADFSDEIAALKKQHRGMRKLLADLPKR